jgi:hypothetical protein
MTRKADEYRANALECEQRAEQTHDAFIKAQPSARKSGTWPP